jgi:hypothetical protein
MLVRGGKRVGGPDPDEGIFSVLRKETAGAEKKEPGTLRYRGVEHARQQTVSVNGIEILFFRTAFRANPVVRKVFKRGPGVYAVLIVPFFRIVDVSAGAFVFLHAVLL